MHYSSFVSGGRLGRTQIRGFLSTVESTPCPACLQALHSLDGTLKFLPDVGLSQTK